MTRAGLFLFLALFAVLTGLWAVWGGYVHLNLDALRPAPEPATETASCLRYDASGSPAGECSPPEQRGECIKAGLDGKVTGPCPQKPRE